LGQGCRGMYVTEDTVPQDPATVKRLYTTAIRWRCSRDWLCDPSPRDAQVAYTL